MHFLKKLTRMATPAELSEIHEKFDDEMQGLTQEWALESLGVERLLPLLNLADNEELGKTKAILYAYRFGYLAGKENKTANQKDSWKQSIIEIINKIDNDVSLMKIFYFVKVFLH